MLRKSRRRQLSAYTALAVAGSMLFAVSASADGEFAPRQQIQSVKDVAATMGGDDADKAVEELGKALEDGLWMDDSTLGEDGKKVFDKMRKATKKLDEVSADESTGAVVKLAAAVDLSGELVAAGTELASLAIDKAVAAGASGDKIEKAKKAMAEAETLAKEGNSEKALKHLLKAWKEAEKALDKMTSGSGGDDGKWAEYDVVLFRVGTDGTNPEDFIEVSGTNKFGTPGYTGKGNEGYLFAPEFTAVDSFHGSSLMYDGMQGMQLHVSCSDAFPEGYGAKSDPAMEANWVINTIDIVKYSNGVIDKTCGVVGTGLPVPGDPGVPEVCVYAGTDLAYLCP